MFHIHKKNLDLYINLKVNTSANRNGIPVLSYKTYSLNIIKHLFTDRFNLIYFDKATCFIIDLACKCNLTLNSILAIEMNRGYRKEIRFYLKKCLLLTFHRESHFNLFNKDTAKIKQRM